MNNNNNTGKGKTEKKKDTNTKREAKQHQTKGDKKINAHNNMIIIMQKLLKVHPCLEAVTAPLETTQ